MAGKCKACFSQYKDVLEVKLKGGESVDKISVWLKTQGEMISGPSLQRHRTNHMDLTRYPDGTVGNILDEPDTPPEQLGGEVFIDSEKFLNDIEADLKNTDVIHSVVTERRKTQLLMERIVQKQLVIVHELQTKYSAGTVGYPDSQIRGLKTLLDIVNSLPTYSDHGGRLRHKIEESEQLNDKDKMKKRAVDYANALNNSYEPWKYLTSGNIHNGFPFNEIEKKSKVLFPHNSRLEREYIVEMKEIWEENFNANIGYEWVIEKKLDYAYECIDDSLPKSDIPSSEIRVLVINEMKEKWKTPREVPVDDLSMYDDDEELGELEVWLFEKIRYYEAHANPTS